jgi:DNA-binding NtrC family response regulator
LRRHDWPGNVRELRNALERCVLLSEASTMQPEWLQLGRLSYGTGDGEALPGELRFRLDGSKTLDDMDREIILAALQQSDFNVTATAKALGTTRETIRYRMRKHGLGRPGSGARGSRRPGS